MGECRLVQVDSKTGESSRLGSAAALSVPKQIMGKEQWDLSLGIQQLHVKTPWQRTVTAKTCLCQSKRHKLSLTASDRKEREFSNHQSLSLGDGRAMCHNGPGRLVSEKEQCGRGNRLHGTGRLGTSLLICGQTYSV